jgi:hypothetical protein
MAVLFRREYHPRPAHRQPAPASASGAAPGDAARGCDSAGDSARSARTAVASSGASRPLSRLCGRQPPATAMRAWLVDHELRPTTTPRTAPRRVAHGQSARQCHDLYPPSPRHFKVSGRFFGRRAAGADFEKRKPWRYSQPAAPGALEDFWYYGLAHFTLPARSFQPIDQDSRRRELTSALYCGFSCNSTPARCARTPSANASMSR